MVHILYIPKQYFIIVQNIDTFITIEFTVTDKDWLSMANGTVCMFIVCKLSIIINGFYVLQ